MNEDVIKKRLAELDDERIKLEPKCAEARNACSAIEDRLRSIASLTLGLRALLPTEKTVKSEAIQAEAVEAEAVKE